jgi:type I restriction enzyme S subunit
MSFPRYPTYKDSGVEWLGEVPGHWALKPLWTHFRRVKRTGFETEQLLSVYRDYGVITKASRDDNFNKPSDDLSVYQLVVPGDLAINKMKAWQGSVAISDHRGIVSPAYFVYEALHKADGRFLHYLMRSMRYITGYLSVSKGIRVNQWDLEPQLHSRMPLVVPPLPERTQIAAFLDRETAKIDELVAEQRRLMALLKEKRQAVISHAVTRGLNPHAPMKPSGIEWLGDVPEHWEVTKIGYVASVSRGTGYQNVEEVEEGEDAIQMIRISDFNDFDPVWVRNSSTLDSYMVDSTDILIAGTGASAGITMRVSEDMKQMIHSYNAPRIRCSKIDPQYAYFVLNSQGIKQQEDLLFSGSAQPFLDLHSISKLELPYCDRKEQLEIVDYLSEQLDEFAALEKEAQRAIDLLQERRTALISAAVTGQIDVRSVV